MKSIAPSPEQDKISSLTELLQPNVSCHGDELTRQLVPDQLDSILERRANEYKQHQLRRKTHADIIIAPANSPLQYPITGFKVAPLKKSMIPGLALQTQGRGKSEVYKVSLSVKSGVLSVEDVLDGDQVEGQGQSNLTISSNNLTQLNDLLSRVTYTSTIYHIRTSDLVHFFFEDHEAMFPIMIRRPSVPVLYDPGNGDQFYFVLEFDEGDMTDGGCLRRIRGFHQPLPGYDGCFLVDGVINYFLARTDAVRSVGFDPFLKRVGHTEFFIDGLGKLLVASCKGLSVGHQTHRAQDKYDSYRNQGKLDEVRKLLHHFFKNYLNYIKY
ncbi:beta-1,4 N-acetylgalactosaminyltransferase 1-like [Sinocyclocheilus rhinocerous]|uniref:beta-1,4 N-acetylgalactosaminyltransferase 1-like n=1 Tax=Sinocyclocheilus rhinocerous TaxID=307959 RepID=UPI0007BA28B4|nr:PREDICTED: beta-1,4 N-acetylgalactosaminyltransferase 1-like [Sinocyclocheilus rhinocerous]